MLVEARSAQGADKALLAALGLLSIGVSWWTVHTIFTLRYALLSYLFGSLILAAAVNLVAGLS